MISLCNAHSNRSTPGTKVVLTPQHNAGGWKFFVLLSPSKGGMRRVDIGRTAYHALNRANFRPRFFKKELKRHLTPFLPTERYTTKLLLLLARR
jgi:hypothetical protein